MTFSYSASEATAKDRVRGLIGDTQEQALKSLSVSDETITAILATADSELSAAITCVDRLLAAAAARDVGTAGRGAGLDATRRFDRLRELRALLRRQLATQNARPVAPYQSVAFVEAMAADSTIIQTELRLGHFDGDA